MVLTEAQRTVVENNMGLVGTVMKEKLNGGSALSYYSYDDLFQIGCIGLCKAAATDNGIGCFSTYAYRVIWNEICDALIHATGTFQKKPASMRASSHPYQPRKASLLPRVLISNISSIVP